MKLYTYYEPLPEHYAKEHHEDVVNLWLEAWMGLGYECSVLTRNDASKHPQYEWYLEKIRKFPSLNPKPFEEACFLRWLAADSAFNADGKNFVMMDYDVFPTKYFDGSVFDNNNGQSKSFGETPCCILIDEFDARSLWSIIGDFVPDKDCGHVSDQTILRGVFHHNSNDGEVSCYGTFSWFEYPLVHFANWTLRRDIKSRAETIRSFMRNGTVDPELCQ